MPLKWIPRSISGASKSQPHWAAHTRIDNVWEYPSPPPPASMGFESMASALVLQCSILYILKNHTLGAGQSMLLSYHLKIRDLVDIKSDV